jgi:hypothetical protein
MQPPLAFYITGVRPRTNPGLPEAPPPSSKKEEGSGVAGVFSSTLEWAGAQVAGCHAGLVPLAGAGGAWAVLASPGLVLIVLLLVLAFRRRARRARRGPAKLLVPTASAAPARVESTASPPSRKDPAPARASKPIEPLKLEAAERLLLAGDGARPSMHESLLVLGADLAGLEALRSAARTALDPALWAAAVKEQRPARLAPMRSAWIRGVAAARVERWLSAHPLVLARGLGVQVPAVLEKGELDGLTLTLPDGLAAPSSGPCLELLEQARRFLGEVLEDPDDPYLLVEAARSAGIPLVEAAGEVPDVLALAAVLHGLPAFERGVRRSAVDPVPVAGGRQQATQNEFRRALEEHSSLMDSPVPAEGCSVHALRTLGRPPPEGVGVLLAAVAGAAFSPAAVLVRVSKLAAERPSPAQREALSQLGQRVRGLLSEDGDDARKLRDNLRHLLGLELLRSEEKRAEELLRAVEKLAAKAPIWRAPADVEGMDLVLARLHVRLIGQALLQGEAAGARLHEHLERLAATGQNNEHSLVASLRLGYVVAGLGVGILRGVGTDLLSLGREAEKVVRELVDQRGARPGGT